MDQSIDFIAIGFDLRREIHRELCQTLGVGQAISECRHVRFGITAATDIAEATLSREARRAFARVLHL